MTPRRSAVARVAVLGCGRGDLVLAIARTSPDVIVAGFDVDGAAIAVARRHGAQAGVSDRVTFEVADRVLGDGYDVVFARIG